MKNKRNRRKPRRSFAQPSTPQQGDRLQKVLAAAGLGSRRQCEELITAGRVEVDRRVVTELGTRVDPLRQQIRVDGDVLKTAKLEYYAVNKPQGVVSTSRDPAGRPRVIDLLPDKVATRLFAVGRLDLASEGLILLTNDGELANRLTHPRYGVAKTYRATVAGTPDRETLLKLHRGVRLAEGVARAERVKIISSHGRGTVLEMVLREGKNREIRRILARVGHKVLRLTRTAVGPVRLGDLPSGAVRRLSREEIAALKKTAHAPDNRSRGNAAKIHRLV
jgi:23S rRNA pseudouridine2605 synthase